MSPHRMTSDKNTVTERAVTPEKGSKRDRPKCSYSHFDPKTLAPLNESTARRMRETGFTAQELSGRHVLDIGCHTGHLSFIAAKLGAASVRSYDVTPAFIEELRASLAQNGLPVTAERKGFSDIDPELDRADVVFFFEVIHWVVSQGTPIPQAIAKLAQLTRERLFIEFPWNADEPSIRAQTKLTAESYDSSLILKELCRYFRSVEIRQFMSYAGTDGPSVRALVTATGKKTSGALLSSFPDLTGLEMPLPWGRGNCVFLEGRERCYVAKRPAPESSLNDVDPKLLGELFAALHGATDGPLALPLERNGEYVHQGAEGERIMVFEWLDDPPVTAPPPPRLSLETRIHIALEVSKQLARVPEDLAKRLGETSMSRALNPEQMRALASRCGSVLSVDRERIDHWIDVARTLDPKKHQRICHGDLNSSNVLEVDGSTRVVDLDNFLVGSPYTDVLFILAALGASKDDVQRYLDLAEKEIPGAGPPSQDDVLFGVHWVLGWLAATSARLAEHPDPNLEELVARHVRGLKTLMEYGQALPRADRAGD